MNGHEIEYALRAERLVRDKFIGVFPADQIPGKEYPGGYIINTDVHGRPGQHWVAFYCTESGSLQAFDSFGVNSGSYPEHIKEWMDESYTLLSQNVLQSADSTLCGNYCLYFLLLRCHGLTYEDVISVFCNDKETNDFHVCRFINEYFKLRTQIQDSTFIIQKLKEKWI